MSFTILVGTRPLRGPGMPKEPLQPLAADVEVMEVEVVQPKRVRGMATSRPDPKTGPAKNVALPTFSTKSFVGSVHAFKSSEW